MKSGLILICAVVLGPAICAQTYRVDIPNPFRTPDYLAMNLQGDQCGFASKFWSEFDRAGFNVVTHQQATRFLKPPAVEADERDVLVDIHNLLTNALKVDPTILPMKEKKLVRYLRESGIHEAVQEGIREGVKQSVFVALPGKKIALNPDAEAPQRPVSKEGPWTPPQVYTFSFNYTYRTSMRCGSTATELRAAINDQETGETMCSVRFDQPSLAGRCPSDIAYELVQRIKNGAHYELDVNLGPAPMAAKTIAAVGESGFDCQRMSSEQWVERLGAELLSQYTLVDRQEVDHLIEEQTKNMAEGAFEDSNLIEAGKLLGAEAMLFGTLGCRSNKTIADVKLVSTSTGAALWTAHGENADPNTMAKYVLHELRALDKQP